MFYRYIKLIISKYFTDVHICFRKAIMKKKDYILFTNFDCKKNFKYIHGYVSKYKHGSFFFASLYRTELQSLTQGKRLSH